MTRDTPGGLMVEQQLGVQITKTMEYKTMNYTKLVPVLIKVVQEQQEVIKQLQKEAEKLKKK
ncbi:MAG: hypothetical protein MK198_03100 [Gracilimonas sp.]|uniref:hypothetical protein n=1 Tax=Gracilimonas sp. TaxID=1974203 RepID=UPI003751DC53|nr:hypothetical protein [Gracilimonas sp.]